MNMTSNTMESNFYVFNKKGQYVELDFNKVLNRLNNLKNKEPKLTVNVPIIAQHTIKMMVSGISTRKLDDISSNFCASNITNNTDYDKMAVRIEVDNLHRETKNCYLETTNILNNYLSPHSSEKIEMLHPKLIKFVERNYNYVNQVINYENDYKYCYFGLKTLMKSYLLKHNGVIKERPQQMLMRVSIGIHLTEVDEEGNCSVKTLDSIKETYQMMSNKQYTHATPTLFNAGTHRQSLSSCFLLSVDDSLVDIYKTLTDTAMISKWSGGVGIHVSQVRAHKSLIRSTNGESEGLVPMLKMYNDSAVYVSQGGGKRKGSTAVYLEMWHADIEDFLDLKKPIGDEMRRARDLFLALWVCDLFMERLIKAVTTGETVMWSLFCPNKAKGLVDVYGDEYKELYMKYENAKIYEKQVSIKELWTHVLEIQQESGNPYVMFKDHVNRKTNQNSLGTIKSSNLCAEITIYTDKNNVGVCNLSSLCLSKFVKKDELGNYSYDYNKLHAVAKKAVENLNRVIDNNVYPVKEGKKSDEENRPIGLGVQSLAKVFFKLKLPFVCEESKEINKKIFETIYHAALEKSCELAKEHGPYKNYEGSMISKGKLQMDLWGVTPSDMWDWDVLRNNIKQYGVRNSLLMALMPTASTAQIMGNTESFEPITSNIFVRNTLSGSYQIVNKHLIKDLEKLNMWNDNMKQQIIARDGSVQTVEGIPDSLKKIYLTVWEISQRDLIDMEADRNCYVCQSTSSNRYLKNPDNAKLTSMHVYSWKKGLKTGMYYLRSQAAASAVKFNVDTNILNDANKSEGGSNVEEEECLMCSA